MLALLPTLGLVAIVSAAVFQAAPVERAFIVQLSPSKRIRGESYISQFHKRASLLDYSVRHEFTNLDVFSGLSIQVNGNLTNEEILLQLRDIPEVMTVSPVMKVGVPIQPGASAQDPMESYQVGDLKRPAPTPGERHGTLATSLQMGGIDKLHSLGIKGKGVKVGIIDTGIDYRHPALGNGFGPGHKVAGGFSFVDDKGTLGQSPDPLVTCYGGGHGTHVAGIIGMENDTFDITGVAPEASIYMYRVFDCNGHAGSDTIMAAMSKAHGDGMDVVSMSLGLGSASFNGVADPLATVTKQLTESGIAVIIAQGNDANGSSHTSDLYTEEWPSTEPTAIGVAAISNAEFPVVYTATDPLGANIKYASVYPLNMPDGADVYMISDACSSQGWIDAIAAAPNVNKTIFAFRATQGCKATMVGSWSGAKTKPVYIMAINTDGSSPYLSDYDTPSQGFFGTTQFINVNAADGVILGANLNKAGGFGKYKIKFTDRTFIGTPQVSGGLIDYYSSFGPTWHDYIMKPQLAAPGGHVLSTWPLGPLGGYAILSGTSMATPYITGCYALLKSQLPNASIQELLDRLQTTSHPVQWAYNRSIISSTAQQGAGMIDVYDALFSRTVVSPGQLLISDLSKTVYGKANITLQNTSPESKTYTFSHAGAGYMDYYIPWNEKSQLAMYGFANFSTPTVTVPAGMTATVEVSISPPKDVVPSNLPVFGGFVKVASNDESFSIPYLGPPYSLYNTPHLLVTTIAGSGIQLPEVYAYNIDQSNVTYDTGLLEFIASYGYGGSIPTVQWTKHIRLDVLPADTNITANHYGFDRSVEWDYIPPSTIPGETIFGHPSFGVLLNNTGYLWPNGNNPSVDNDKVMGGNRAKYRVGNGDFRWFASVLRWSGTMGMVEDYETWLGPVVRFVDAPSTTVKAPTRRMERGQRNV